MIVRFDDKFNLTSPDASIDLERFQANVAIRSDFTDSNCWPVRDGVSMIEPFVDDNKPAMKLSLGNMQSQNGSRWIHRAEINLQEAPYMDFYIRTSGAGPLSFMFQVEGRDDWFELALQGTQNYTLVATLGFLAEINDGKWHRLTWNLQKVEKEKIGQDVLKIKHLIIGNWQTVDEPVVVDFKSFNMGRENQLDGLEQDNTQ